MGSITQSPDRMAQVVSETAAQIGAGDSALQPAHSNPAQVVEQTFTGISAAEMAYDSNQQNSPVSLSEGVASAGHPTANPVDRTDEFVPAPFDLPISAAQAGYEGETSGGNDVTGGSNGYGDLTAAIPQSHHNYNIPHHPSAQPVASTQQREHHHHRNQQQSSPMRLSNAMDFQATGSVHIPTHHHMSGKRKSYADGSEILEPKRPEGAGGLNRVPSDLALVMGLSDGEGGDPVEAPSRRHHNHTHHHHQDDNGHHEMVDACDSNMAGIVAGVAGAAPTYGEGEILQMNNNNDNTNNNYNDNNNNTVDGAIGPATTDQGRVPTDADIIEWQNKIREEGIRNIPLIGDIEPLLTLEDEYRAGSDIFIRKIASLQGGYSSIRRTRGDGNCFFRSFIFAYLEHILTTGDIVERDAAVTRLIEVKQRLLDFGYDDLVMETPLELLLGMLRSINAIEDPLTMAELEAKMQAEDVSNYIIFLLRMITSAEVKRRAEFFAPFIMGLSDMDVDSFCSRCIDPMGEESDHVQMVALTDAFHVPMRVVYLDRSARSPGDEGEGGSTLDGAQGGTGGGGGDGDDGGDMVDASPTSRCVGMGGSISIAGAASAAIGGSTVNTVVSEATVLKVDVHDFIPDGASKEPLVHLLYRPGHYDVLYSQK